MTAVATSPEPAAARRADTPASPPPVTPAGRRNLLTIAVYRVVSGLILVGVALLLDLRSLSVAAPYSFVVAAGFYLAYGVVGAWWIWREPHPLSLPVLQSALVAGDILFIALLTLASGGTGGPLPILLFPQLAASGWLLRMRTALFHAALASVVLLGLDAWHLLEGQITSAQSFQTGLIGFGYFATIGISVMLGSYARASEALAAQRGIDIANLEQVNRLIIQDMQDGVLVVDNAGRVRSHNAQAMRLLGAYGRAKSDEALATVSPALEAKWQRWRAERDDPGAPLSVEGTQRMLRVRIVQIGSGADGGAMIYLEDLGRAQHEAQQIKLAAMGRLTASIAHEVRNPLAAINHAAQLLEEDGAVAAQDQRLLAMIRSNAKRIDRIVGEVLQLTRRDRQDREAIALSEFLPSLLEEIGRAERIPASSVAIVAGGDLAVLFDRGQLSQIVWNLVRNGWQHCRKVEGSIRIAARAGYLGDAVILEVTDDGPGIPEEQRTHLFEPFFTTRQGGTGLGLYVARELADANGATLELLPDGPGARFRLKLRRATSPPGRRSDAAPPT